MTLYSHKTESGTVYWNVNPPEKEKKRVEKTGSTYEEATPSDTGIGTTVVGQTGGTNVTTTNPNTRVDSGTVTITDRAGNVVGTRTYSGGKQTGSSGISNKELKTMDSQTQYEQTRKVIETAGYKDIEEQRRLNQLSYQHYSRADVNPYQKGTFEYEYFISKQGQKPSQEMLDFIKEFGITSIDEYNNKIEELGQQPREVTDINRLATQNILTPDKSVVYDKFGYGYSINPEDYEKVTSGDKYQKFNWLSYLPSKTTSALATPEELLNLEFTPEQQKMLNAGWININKETTEYNKLNIKPITKYTLGFTDIGKTKLEEIQKQAYIEAGKSTNLFGQIGQEVTGSLRTLSLAMFETAKEMEGKPFLTGIPTFLSNLPEAHYQATAESMLRLESAYQKGGYSSLALESAKGQLFGSVAGQTLINIGILKGFSLGFKGLALGINALPNLARLVPGGAKLVPALKIGTQTATTLAGVGLTGAYLYGEGKEIYTQIREPPSPEKYERLISSGIRLGVFLPEIYSGAKSLFKQVTAKKTTPSKLELIEKESKSGKNIYEVTYEKGKLTIQATKGNIRQVFQEPFREKRLTLEKPQLSVPTQAKKLIAGIQISQEGSVLSFGTNTGLPEYYGGVPKVETSFSKSIFGSLGMRSFQETSGIITQMRASGKIPIYSGKGDIIGSVQTPLSSVMSKTPMVTEGGQIKWIDLTPSKSFSYISPNKFLEPPKIFLDYPSNKIGVKKGGMGYIAQKGTGLGKYSNIITLEAYTETMSRKDLLPKLEATGELRLPKKISKTPIYPKESMSKKLDIKELNLGGTLTFWNPRVKNIVLISELLGIRGINQPKYTKPQNVVSVAKISEAYYKNQLKIAMAKAGEGQVYEQTLVPQEQEFLGGKEAITGFNILPTTKKTFMLGYKPEYKFEPEGMIFSGTGLIGSLSSKELLKTKPISDISQKIELKLKPSIDITTKPDTITEQKPDIKPGVTSLTISDTTTEQKPEIRQIQIFEPITKTQTKQRTELRLKLKEKVPEEPKPSILGIQIKRKEKEKKGVSFQSYIKEKGKFRPMGKPTTEREAMDIASKYVDDTPSARFKITRVNKPAQKNFGVSQGYFNMNKNKFRQYKIRKGTKLPMNKEYIEKETYRMDKPNEKKGIQEKGVFSIKLKKWKKIF